jgi:hypothetical protein
LIILFVPAAVFGCVAEPPPGDDERGPHYEDLDSDDPSDELYALANLPRFDIELSDESYQALIDEPREYTTGRLIYRGEVVDGIGIRLKGEYSFRDIDEKPGFKLKFDKFVSGQLFRGLERMTLNNNVQDPSFLSQPIAFHAYRSAGLPAPRANSALVYVNGEFYGVYSNVETEDDTFIARWFEDASGNLYEEGGLDFLPGNAGIFDLETNEDIDDRSDLEALIAAVDRATPETFMAEVGAHLDLEHFLSYCSMELVMGGEDGYAYGIGSRNNFRVYSDPTSGKFYFLPWGVDRALRPRNAPLLVHEWVDPVPVFQSPWEIYGVILEKCTESIECRAAYVEHIEATLVFFEQLDLDQMMETQYALIEADVLADERKEESDEYVEYALETMRGYIDGRPGSIVDELPPSPAP